MRQESQKPRRRSAGLTFIELLVAVTVLMVLAAAAIPIYRWNDKRKKEVELRGYLVQMREAIDLYKKYSDEGLIQQTDVEQMGYPRSLEELVEGVEVGDPQSPQAKKVQFLGRLPKDPFTDDTKWGMRSYQDDWDSDGWGGENVYDVYSLSPAKALNDTYYSEW